MSYERKCPEYVGIFVNLQNGLNIKMNKLTRFELPLMVMLLTLLLFISGCRGPKLATADEQMARG